MSWAELFEATDGLAVKPADVSESLASRRPDDGSASDASGDHERPEDDASGAEIASDPMTRVVADADVLAADVLLDGPSRGVLDLVRSHDWVALLGSDQLVDDARAVLEALAGESVADTWATLIEDRLVRCSHPAGDHPAVASAVAGDARHVISLDKGLQSAGAGLAIRREASVEVSVRSPEAFVQLFDPADVYEAVYDDGYPGPDRDPRA